MGKDLYFALALTLLTDAALLGGSSEAQRFLQQGMKRLDCDGSWSQWTVCLPLEGHVTHHDAEDLWNIPVGPDGLPMTRCFRKRTYTITQQSSRGGRSCQHRSGIDEFSPCDDCKDIPMVSANSPPPEFQGLSPGATLGIAVATTTLCLLFVFSVIAVYRCYRRKKKQRVVSVEPESCSPSPMHEGPLDLSPEVFGKLAHEEIDDQATEADFPTSEQRLTTA